MSLQSNFCFSWLITCWHDDTFVSLVFWGNDCDFNIISNGYRLPQQTAGNLTTYNRNRISKYPTQQHLIEKAVLAWCVYIMVSLTTYWPILLQSLIMKVYGLKPNCLHHNNVLSSACRYHSHEKLNISMVCLTYCIKSVLRIILMGYFSSRDKIGWQSPDIWRDYYTTTWDLFTHFTWFFMFYYSCY